MGYGGSQLKSALTRPSRRVTADSGQLGLCSEFQASLGFRVSPSLKKERKETSSQAALPMLLPQQREIWITLNYWLNSPLSLLCP